MMGRLFFFDGRGGRWVNPGEGVSVKEEGCQIKKEEEDGRGVRTSKRIMQCKLSRVPDFFIRTSYTFVERGKMEGILPPKRLRDDVHVWGVEREREKLGVLAFMIGMMKRRGQRGGGL